VGSVARSRRCVHDCDRAARANDRLGGRKPWTH
jgi:hypothetical protein